MLRHIMLAALWCEAPITVTFFIAATQLCQVYLRLCPHVGSTTLEGVEPHRSEKSLDYNAQALQLWP